MTTCSTCTYFHGKYGITCAVHPAGPGQYDCPDYRDAVGIPMVGRVAADPWLGQLGTVVGWDRYGLKIDIEWDNGKETHGIPLWCMHLSDGTAMAFV